MKEPSTVLVFGASGGIGSALCRKLAESGVRLALLGRRQAPLEELSATLPGSSWFTADATDLDQAERAVSQAHRHFGKIDGVVNCVGSLLLKPAHLTAPDEWADVVAQNLTSSFNVVRASVRCLMQQPTGGSIVLISSAAAQFGLPNHEAISAAKAGVIGLARSAASTYARYNIRVNCVAPGLTRTPLTAHITENSASLATSVGMHALGRIATPAEVASLISWLLDPENSFATGQVIALDGGLSSVQPRPQIQPRV
jgi:3-oxoacyl-[acyl-carrier protein] reductase